MSPLKHWVACSPGSNRNAQIPHWGAWFCLTLTLTLTLTLLYQGL